VSPAPQERRIVAGSDRRGSPRRADLQRRDRPRKDHPHAVRILARAWLYVIWDCWHNAVPHDPARHRALQRLLAAQSTDADQAA
jgi:hypothetical protein